MRNITKLTVAVFWVGLLVGCGSKSATEGATDNLVEQAAEKALAAQGEKAGIDISRDGNNMTITVNDENNQQSKTVMNVSGSSSAVNITGADGSMKMQSGSAAAIPESFPKDVPLYPGASLKMVMEMEGKGHTVSAGTKDGANTVTEFFKKNCVEKGWKESMVMAQGADSAMLHYIKDDRILMIIVGSEDGETTINITSGQQ